MHYVSDFSDSLFKLKSVPTPRVAVSLPDYILFAGTTISVTCRISLSESVDNNVSLHVTWLNGNVSISNDTGQVSLSGAKPSFTSILAISSLSDLDNNTELTCQASAHSSIDLITTSSNGENSTRLYVIQRC